MEVHSSAVCALFPGHTVVDAYQTDWKHGLTSAQVDARRVQFGPNAVEKDERESLFWRFFDGLKDPMILLLLASAAISLLIGQYDDAVSITLAVLIVLTVATIQEYKSDQSLEALGGLAPPKCHVVRDGHVHDIIATDVVPGDIVIFVAGDRIPADVRIIEALELSIEQSIMTGESDGVPKSSQPIQTDDVPFPVRMSDAGDSASNYLENESPLSQVSAAAANDAIELRNRNNIAFTGTLVQEGRGRGVVIATGSKSELGEMMETMKNMNQRASPLQERMGVLGKQLSVASLSVIAIIVLIGVFQQKPLLDMFMIGVSLAVAAIPEGLPIVVAVTLALGVQRMAAHKAVVKRLTAVETLGCASVICTDKTGTLTRNEMTVTKGYTAGLSVPTRLGGGTLADTPALGCQVVFHGVGYHGHKGQAFIGEDVADCVRHPHVGALFEAAAVCNNSNVRKKEAFGQATEAALLTAAAKVGLRGVRDAYHRTFEIPFKHSSPWMVVRVRPKSETERRDSAVQEEGRPRSLSESSHSPTFEPLQHPPGTPDQPMNAAAAASLLTTTTTMGPAGAAGGREPSPTSAAAEAARNLAEGDELTGSGEEAFGDMTANDYEISRAMQHTKEPPAMEAVQRGTVEEATAVPGEFYYAKGAFQPILDRCASVLTPRGAIPMTPARRTELITEHDRMASEGLRVLAVATGTQLTVLPETAGRRHAGHDPTTASFEQGMCFLGLLGLHDPPREGVREAVTRLSESKVRTIMITGDGEKTAIAIAKNLGIIPDSASPPLDIHASPVPARQEVSDGATIGGEAAGAVVGSGTPTASDALDVEVVSVSDPVEMLAISGAEMNRLTEQQLVERLRDVRVFYRTTPDHKRKIVDAYHARGETVVMTGDGVNDAVALKAADIGVAMGLSGTEVAKEASAMVLLDDNFATIVHAIEEGKGIFFNIRHFVRFQLSTGVAALSLIAISNIMGLPNPLNAMQILWINIIMDGPPAQSLGVEPVDDAVKRQPPRPKEEPIVTLQLLSTVILAAAVIVAGTLNVFTKELQDGVVTERDTTMTFCTFVMFDMFNAYSCRSSTRSVFSIGLFANQFFLLAIGGSIGGQLLVVYAPPLQSVFQTEAISLRDWVEIIVLTSTVLWVDELRKLLLNCPPLGRRFPPRGGSRKSAKQKQSGSTSDDELDGTQPLITHSGPNDGRTGTSRRRQT